MADEDWRECCRRVCSIFGISCARLTIHAFDVVFNLNTYRGIRDNSVHEKKKSTSPMTEHILELADVTEETAVAEKGGK